MVCERLDASGRGFYLGKLSAYVGAGPVVRCVAFRRIRVCVCVCGTQTSGDIHVLSTVFNRRWVV